MLLGKESTVEAVSITIANGGEQHEEARNGMGMVGSARVMPDGMRRQASGGRGKLVDGNGTPVALMKIIASKVLPFKGHDQLETITEADGSFRLAGLFPASIYTLRYWSEKSTANAPITIDIAPPGQTSVLPTPMALRFTTLADGVIYDAQTDLDWLVGDNRDTNFDQAQKDGWRASVPWRVAAGECRHRMSWRCYTNKASASEILTCYLKPAASGSGPAGGPVWENLTLHRSGASASAFSEAKRTGTPETTCVMVRCLPCALI